jgi:hypothetical protein
MPGVTWAPAAAEVVAGTGDLLISGENVANLAAYMDRYNRQFLFSKYLIDEKTRRLSLLRLRMQCNYALSGR